MVRKWIHVNFFLVKHLPLAGTSPFETLLELRTPVSLADLVFEAVIFTGNAEAFQKNSAVVARMLSVDFLDIK